MGQVVNKESSRKSEGQVTNERGKSPIRRASCQWGVQVANQRFKSPMKRQVESNFILTGDHKSYSTMTS